MIRFVKGLVVGGLLLFQLSAQGEEGPDSLTPSMPVVVDKKDILWRWNGQVLEPVAAWQDRRGKWKSFFDEVLEVAVHGGTGRIAIVGRHKLLNDGKRTVFVVDADGGLTVVASYEVTAIETDPKARRFDAALIEHSRAAQVIGARDSKAFRDEVHTVFSGLPFANGDRPPITIHGLRWNQDGDRLLLITEHDGFALSIDQGLLRHVALKPYAKRNLPLQPKLMEVSGDASSFAPTAIRSRNAVHLLDWDGNLQELWGCNDRTLMATDPVSGKTYDTLDCGDGVFQVFAGGRYFLLDHFILNAGREPVMAVGPTRHWSNAEPSTLGFNFNGVGNMAPAGSPGRAPTRFFHLQRTHIDAQGRHLATYTTDSRRVSIVDLSTRELRAEIEVDYGLVDHLQFSPDGRSLFLYIGKQGQGKRTYYAHHYQIDDNGQATRLQGVSDVDDAYITDCCLLVRKRTKVLVYEPGEDVRQINPGKTRLRSIHLAEAL